MESFEFPGVWWLPTDPDKTKFYGPLKFDPKNGGKLSLTFDMDGAEHEGFGNHADLCLPIVHGKMDGRKVTLTKCHKRYRSGENSDSARNAYTQTVSVWTDTVFLGVHFKSLLDIKFAWMSVSYTHLDNWLGIQRFPFNHDGQRTQGVEAPVDDVLKILFYRATYEEIGEKRPPYPQVLVAQIAADEKMPYESQANEEELATRAFHPYIDRYLRDFLNLVTGEPNYPFNISSVSPYDNKQLVKIFYRIPGYDPEARRRVEVSFTFAYEFIQPRFPFYLKNWVENSSALQLACDLFFKRYYLSNIDVETQFTFLVQAIEAYHRRKYGDTYLDLMDYERLTEMLSAEIKKVVKTSTIQSSAQGEVDPDNVNSLKQKLLNAVKYGNDYSLRRRLKKIREDVLQDNLELVDDLLENHSVFIHRVTETRNFLAHRLKERDQDVLKDSEYPDYVRKLRKLLRLCFLVEMGLQPEDIEILSQYCPSNTP